MTPPPSPGGSAGVGTDGAWSAARTDRLPVASRRGGSPGGGRPVRARGVTVLPEPSAEPAPKVVTALVVTSAASRAASAEPDPAIAPDDPTVGPPSGRGLGARLRRPALRRPELRRSTTVLLGLLGAVLLVAGGAFLGRFTAPEAAGPAAVTGSVESVSGDTDSTQLTVRTPDGNLVVFTATTATVGAPRDGGLGALRPGQQVTVDPEIDQRGGLAARTVLVQTTP